jgi:hypothetical protein
MSYARILAVKDQPIFYAVPSGDNMIADIIRRLSASCRASSRRFLSFVFVQLNSRLFRVTSQSRKVLLSQTGPAEPAIFTLVSLHFIYASG